MSKQRLNNEEFIGELMMFSPKGALCQIFIIEAIRYYAEQVSSTPKPEEGGKSFIDAIAWWEVAEDISKKIKLQYES